MAKAGAKFSSGGDVVVGEVQFALCADVAEHVAAKDAAAGIGGGEDVVLLRVLKQSAAGDLAFRGVLDGTETAAVVRDQDAFTP